LAGVVEPGGEQDDARSGLNVIEADLELALDAGEARSAIAAGAVTGARHVVEGPRAAAHGLADIAVGDTPADAQNHRIASLSSNLEGQYRF